MSEPIHQEITFSAPPSAVYDALMNAEKHAAFTGGPAEIDAAPGGRFSCHGGAIVGRTVELEPRERIVWAWRVEQWDPGVYSIVKLELGAEGEGTRLVMDHSGVPAAAREHIDGGWHERYWKPLAAYLAA
jgi:activator of HSP90 ATPase